ncbi:hypothetical protein NARC_10422 [Candidatus Nitrosocosmicus arcticus]|uniref:Uncharacterized protein n=1 Tax=Candidatus Nitrosocosmicus arcticus TaxID=2035267 RepID=A0A557SZJ6_9ARCH|nr:hypothetical protein NARC_10422 [Candidatus Nitrosocosmicus arcticus]
MMSIQSQSLQTILNHESQNSNVMEHMLLVRAHQTVQFLKIGYRNKIIFMNNKNMKLKVINF